MKNLLLTHPTEGDREFPEDEALKIITLPPNKKGEQWSIKDNPDGGDSTSPPALDDIQSDSTQSDANNGNPNQGDTGKASKEERNPKGAKS
jgi:hypothetical protein